MVDKTRLAQFYLAASVLDATGMVINNNFYYYFYLFYNRFTVGL